LKKFLSSKKRFLVPGFIVLAVFLFLIIYTQKDRFLTEDARFEKFTHQLFTEEVKSNTLNLHYTLAYPEKYGIKNYPIKLGSMDPDKLKDSYDSVEEYKKNLEKFTYKELSKDNRITYDILKLDFNTQLSIKDNYMLQEPLSPNLGIQSQLPVLLAEYTFRTSDDIKDYFTLLSSMTGYFDEILEFEKKKAEEGLFMSDTSVDRIIAQCNAFTEDLSANYLSTMFKDKMKGFVSRKAITQKQADSYIKMHEKIMAKRVFPAYQSLAKGLADLKGNGTNSGGLSNLPGGTSYYRYLIRSETGDYRTIKEIEERLYTQLLTDYKKMQSLIVSNPKLLADASSLPETCSSTPAQMLDYLNKAICEDFPDSGKPAYKVKYVHESMENFSSPAFYLTPPADTLSPNIIYINKSSQVSEAELFTTLAHEGFPGHLYQTLYFGKTEPDDIRHLLSFGGYVEGWATYVESLSYGYGAEYLKLDDSLMELLWLNRSVSLCLYSLLDIGIHDHGWDLGTVTKTLNSFGIASQDTCREIFQYIVENPGNYLKYYLGYLNFMDLKKEAQTAAGKSFQLKEFHRYILELGPAQFPVLKKYLLMEYKQ
jgi:uncharacterized protein (DUF885 family)